MTNTTTPKPACIAQDHIPELGIYVTTFDCDPCPSGHLHGAWIDLEDAIVADDIQTGIDWILATSPEPDAKKWAMHDSSGLPRYLSDTYWPDLSELMSWVDGLSAYEDEDKLEAYRLECEKQGQTIDDYNFEQTYRGYYSNEEEFAYQLAVSLGVIDMNHIDFLFNCIDWEKAWGNLLFDYRSEPSNSGGVHIFKNN